MGRDKVIEKLKKMMAHKESAERIGSQEEAEAFAAAIQRMMLQHELSMGEIQTEETQAQNPIDREAINYQEHGIPIKQRRSEWMERLAMVVAKAHFCTIMVVTGSNRILLVGRKSDREVAEYMFVTLYRLLETMSEKEYVRYFYECKEAGNVARARGFKQSFLLGFVNRLARRYHEERRRVEEEARSSGTSIVPLHNLENALAKYMANFKKKASTFTRREQLNFEGLKRGRQAADRVNLKGGALGS